jgi:hypothetical protein
MDASHPTVRFDFLFTVIIPAAPQETAEEAGIEPGTAALQSGSLMNLKVFLLSVLKSCLKCELFYIF